MNIYNILSILFTLLIVSCNQEVKNIEDNTIVIKLFSDKFSAYQIALRHNKSEKAENLVRVVINDITKNQRIQDSKNLIIEYIDSLRNVLKGQQFRDIEKKLIDTLFHNFNNPQLSLTKTLVSFENLIMNEYWKSNFSEPYDKPVIHFGSLDTLFLEHAKTYTNPISAVWESSGSSEWSILKVDDQDSLLDKITIKTPIQSNQTKVYPFKLKIMNDITRESQTLRDTLIVTAK